MSNLSFNGLKDLTVDYTMSQISMDFQTLLWLLQKNANVQNFNTGKVSSKPTSASPAEWKHSDPNQLSLSASNGPQPQSFLHFSNTVVGSTLISDARTMTTFSSNHVAKSNNCCNGQEKTRIYADAEGNEKTDLVVRWVNSNEDPSLFRLCQYFREARHRDLENFIRCSDLKRPARCECCSNNLLHLATIAGFRHIFHMVLK